MQQVPDEFETTPEGGDGSEDLETPEAKTRAEAKAIAQEAKEEFSLDSWLGGGKAKTAKVTLFRDVELVENYSTLRFEQDERRKRIAELHAAPSDLPGLSEQIAEAEAVADAAEAPLLQAREAMLAQSAVDYLQAHPNELVKKFGKQARKEFGLNKLGTLPMEKLMEMQEWIDLNLLGSSIARIATPNGSLPLDADPHKVALALSSGLPESEWLRLDVEFRKLTGIQRIAEDAVADPGF